MSQRFDYSRVLGIPTRTQNAGVTGIPSRATQNAKSELNIRHKQVTWRRMSTHHGLKELLCEVREFAALNYVRS